MVEDQIADGTAFCRCTEHDPGAIRFVQAGGVLTRESAGGAERLLL